MKCLSIDRGLCCVIGWCRQTDSSPRHQPCPIHPSRLHISNIPFRYRERDLYRLMQAQYPCSDTNIHYTELSLIQHSSGPNNFDVQLLGIVFGRRHTAVSQITWGGGALGHIKTRTFRPNPLKWNNTTVRLHWPNYLQLVTRQKRLNYVWWIGYTEKSNCHN